MVRSPVASDILTRQCTDIINEWDIPIHPTYMVKSKVSRRLTRFFLYKKVVYKKAGALEAKKTRKFRAITLLP